MSPIPVRSRVEIIHGFLRVLSLIWSPRMLRVEGTQRPSRLTSLCFQISGVVSVVLGHSAGEGRNRSQCWATDPTAETSGAPCHLRPQRLVPRTPRPLRHTSVAPTLCFSAGASVLRISPFPFRPSLLRAQGDRRRGRWP